MHGLAGGGGPSPPPLRVFSLRSPVPPPATVFGEVACPSRGGPPPATVFGEVAEDLGLSEELPPSSQNILGAPAWRLPGAWPRGAPALHPGPGLEEACAPPPPRLRTSSSPPAPALPGRLPEPQAACLRQPKMRRSPSEGLHPDLHDEGFIWLNVAETFIKTAKRTQRRYKALLERRMDCMMQSASLRVSGVMW